MARLILLGWSKFQYDERMLIHPKSFVCRLDLYEFKPGILKFLDPIVLDTVPQSGDTVTINISSNDESLSMSPELAFNLIVLNTK